MFSGKDVSNIFVNKSYDQSLKPEASKDYSSKYESNNFAIYKDFYQSHSLPQPGYSENSNQTRPNVDSGSSRHKGERQPFGYQPQSKA